MTAKHTHAESGFSPCDVSSRGLRVRENAGGAAEFFMHARRKRFVPKRVTRTVRIFRLLFVFGRETISKTTAVDNSPPVFLGIETRDISPRKKYTSKLECALFARTLPRNNKRNTNVHIHTRVNIYLTYVMYEGAAADSLLCPVYTRNALSRKNLKPFRRLITRRPTYNYRRFFVVFEYKQSVRDRFPYPVPITRPCPILAAATFLSTPPKVR